MRYLQSPLKSLDVIDESSIKKAIKKIYINQYNCICINNIRVTSKYLKQQCFQINRYLNRNARKFSIKIILLIARKYHVNGSSILQDNCLYHLKIIKWIKVIKILEYQLHIIHHYPNFCSLHHSQYQKYIVFDFNLKTGEVKGSSHSRHYILNKKLPLHIKIQLLHIPLASHARVKLAPLRKNHKHYMYCFSAIRGKWHGDSKKHPFGSPGSIMLRKICYQGKEISNHMWIYGRKNLKDIRPMPRGTYFSFRGWVAKYLKHHNQRYDYRINHIRDAKVIRYKS